MKLSRKLKMFINVGLSGVTLFFYQNCGISGSDPQFVSNCIKGKTMQIEQVLDDGTLTGRILNKADIVVYTGDVSAAEQYGYNRYGDNKWGAFPLVTPAPVSRELKIMFYEDIDGLNFTFYTNEIDANISTSVDFDIFVQDNLVEDRALVRDEKIDFRKGYRLTPEQLAIDPRAEYPVPGVYTADLSPRGYTDGGVIGPIQPGPDFAMKVQFLNSTDVKKAEFYSADGTSYILGDENDNESLTSFRIKYKGFEKCVAVY